MLFVKMRGAEKIAGPMRREINVLYSCTGKLPR